MEINIGLDKGILVSYLINHVVKQITKAIHHLRIFCLSGHVTGFRLN